MRLRWHKRPVLLPLCACGNPLLKRLNLFRRKWLSFRRHPLALVGSSYARDECALLDVARHNGVQTGVKFGECGIGLVESQPALTRGWSMAAKTPPGKQRLYIPGK